MTKKTVTISHFQKYEPENEKPPKKIGRIYLLNQIGSGSFGHVYLGYDKKENKYYAVKRVNYKDLCKNVGGINQLEREIRMLRTFDHENIIKLYEVYKAEIKPYVYLVMEYAECGSLYELTDGSPTKYEYEDILSMIKQMVRALNYIHSKGIVHQDIKPANILLCEDGRVLLADFGIGHRFQSAAMVVGSPAYQAPECLDYSDSEDEDDNANDDKDEDDTDGSEKTMSSSSSMSNDDGPIKEDVWMLGVTFYQLLFSKLPFVGNNLFEIVRMIRTTPLQIPENCDPAVAEVLKKMLTVDARQRISMRELANEPILQNANDLVKNPIPKPKYPTVDLETAVVVPVSIANEKEPIYVPRRLSLPAAFPSACDSFDISLGTLHKTTHGTFFEK